jgi:hypothetical protein
MLGGHEGVGPGTAATLRSCMPDKTLEKAKVQRHVWTIGALSTVLARTTPSPRLGTRLWAHCRPPLLLSPAHHSRPCSLRHITIGLVMQPRWGMHVKQRAAARARIEDAPRPGGFKVSRTRRAQAFTLHLKGPRQRAKGSLVAQPSSAAPHAEAPSLGRCQCPGGGWRGGKIPGFQLSHWH